MTGYTVHTGSSEKFSSGWDQIFTGKKSAKKSAPKETQATVPVKAAAKPASQKPAKSAKKKA